MGVTVQVRDLDASVQERLSKSAAKEGLSLSAFLRRELTSLARSLEVRERADLLNAKPPRNPLGGPFPSLQKFSAEDVVALTREDRDTQ